jgi:hypothetical protein
MNLANTIKLQTLGASAGAQATVPDSRSADEWIKKYLDDKNKRLNDLRKELHQLIDFPQPVEIDGAYRVDKLSKFEQMPGRVAGHGSWAVVSPEGEIISRWDTKAEADQAAWPVWKGLKPSATGASGGARVVRLKRKDIAAADIFEDQDLGDSTRRRFIKHDKPQAVKDADILRLKDRRPSSHGQGSAGTGGAGSTGSAGI